MNQPERASGASPVAESGGADAEAARQLAAVLRVSQVPIAFVRLRDRIIVEANEAFSSIFGRTRGESSSAPPAGTGAGLFVSSELEEQAYEQLVANGSFRALECRLRARSGEELTCLVSAELGQIGGEAHAIVSYYDVSEQRAVDEALRRGETELGVMFDFAPVGLAQSDPHTGRFLRVNKRLADMVGYTADELYGMRNADVTHPDDREVTAELFRRLVRGEVGDYKLEKRHVMKDGRTTWVNVNVTVLRASSGAPLRTFATIEDITERKQAEQLQRDTEAQLRAAQKMEAVGRLAGGVAHDFNNLLSVILSYAEVAQSGLRSEDPLRADLHEIVRAAQRAEALTRQLLAFSRRQVLKPESIDLNGLVAGVTRMLARLIGEHIVLDVKPSTSVLPTRADRGQIEQVIMNLAVNARDAMPDGGKLTLSTENVELDDAQAASMEIEPGEYVELAVADTGVGMDAATKARVFEPFFTTKAVGKGTGLGLATVYGIVRQSGGGISVESSPGAGATFRVYLKREEGLEDVAPASVPYAPASPGRETILVVEDEEALRNVIRRVLSSAGYEVIVASGAREALLECAERGREVNLVLTDVVMPGMNGRQLAEKLSPLCPSAKLVFMSGYNDEDIQRHDVLSQNFLRKPFDRKTLTRKVRCALDGVVG
jgi:two-component system cell cycle sensor histidine kinase/response regulator CckA